MAQRVLGGLHITAGTGTFRSVAARCVDLHEARAAFLAVLVLARRQVVDVDQSELFGEITIRSRAPIQARTRSFTAFHSMSRWSIK